MDFYHLACLVVFDVKYYILKFMFSKKATKIDEIFTVDLTLCVKLVLKISSIFVVFLENMNFTNVFCYLVQ